MKLYQDWEKLSKMYPDRQPGWNNFRSYLMESYINGEEIEGVDELENDPDFMMNAIYRSVPSDKYDYAAIMDLCGDNAIKSYCVMDTCLKRFDRRPDVLVKSCKKYLKLNKTNNPFADYMNIETTEIIARTISEIRGDKSHIEDHLDDLIELGEILKARFDYILGLYNPVIKGSKSPFTFLAEHYKNNRFILPFIADRILGDILNTDRADNKLCSIVKIPGGIDDLFPDAISFVLSFDEGYSNYVCANAVCYNKMERRLREELERRIVYTRNKKTYTFNSRDIGRMLIVKKP